LDPSSILNIFLFFLSIFLSAYFLGLKTAFFSLNNSTIDAFAESKLFAEKQISLLLKSKRKLLLTLVMANIISSASAVILSTLIFSNIFNGYSIFSLPAIIFGMAFYFICRLFLGEIVLSILKSKSQKAIIKISILFLLPIYYAFMPVTLLMVRLAHGMAVFLKLDKLKAELSEEELRDIVDVSEEGTGLLKDEKQMIQGIFELSDTITREIMVPRTDMICVENTTSITQLLKINKVNNHSRIPVYEGSIDNIVGILHIKDLIPLIKKRIYSDFNIMKMVNEPYFVPEQKKVNELLQELRIEKIHMAIVVDEYGGTAGVVTLEDVIEEIVGEIQDEYDREAPPVKQIDENNYLVDGSILIDDLNEELGISLPEEEGVDTLAGFLLGKFGSVPKSKNTITWNEYTFVVEKVLNRRVERVRIIKKEQEPV
jgi:magnesium and cobalt exporter, CNNM family